jgi:hypothetical protein
MRVASTKSRQAHRSLACDQSSKGFMNQRGEFLRPGDALRSFQQLLIEVDGRTHDRSYPDSGNLDGQQYANMATVWSAEAAAAAFLCSRATSGIRKR